MLNDYLIVEKSALPDYFIRVVQARRLLESGEYTQVIEAVQAAGISRSTYYKEMPLLLKRDSDRSNKVCTLYIGSACREIKKYEQKKIKGLNINICGVNNLIILITLY